MSMKRKLVALTCVVMLLATVGVGEAFAKPSGRGDVGRDGIQAKITNGKFTPVKRSAADPCDYFPLDWSEGAVRSIPSLPGGNPEWVNTDTGEVWVGVMWDCDGDGIWDGGAIFVAADLNLWGADAFELIPWPELEVVTGPDPVVVSGLPVAFSLAGAGLGSDFADPIPASATDPETTLTVTATATATGVEWQAGAINSRYGGSDTVVCENFGDLSFEWPIDTPCHFTWLSSSALEPGARITLTAVITYDVVYTVNFPGVGDVVFGPPVYDHIIERSGYAVSEAHSVIVE